MGRSFFNGSTDGELATGSKFFVEKLVLSPETYGISQEQADALAALDAEWQAAYAAVTVPGTRCSSQVAAKNQARERLMPMLSSLAAYIGSNPAVSKGQRINLGLGIRAKASPLPEPGTPWGLKTSLDGDGSLILTWKCDNPAGSRGTQYEIWRRLAGGTFVFLQQVGVRRFVDSTLPVGAAGIVYQIRAVRSTKRGPWAQFPVSFGGATTRGAIQLAA